MTKDKRKAELYLAIGRDNAITSDIQQSNITIVKKGYHGLGGALLSEDLHILCWELYQNAIYWRSLGQQSITRRLGMI